MAIGHHTIVVAMEMHKMSPTDALLINIHKGDFNSL